MTDSKPTNQPTKPTQPTNQATNQPNQPNQPTNLCQIVINNYREKNPGLKRERGSFV